MSENKNNSDPEGEGATADCYSDADRGFMEWGQQLRARLLNPLLALMIRRGVTANHLTICAMIFGLGFCPLFFWNRKLAFISLALHVILDGIDGPLARARGTASRRGSFTDTASDQLVVAASTATLISAQLLGSTAGLIYVMSYTVVVGFSMIRNALNIPYSWLIRPRFFVYLSILLECYLVSGILPYVVWTCNFLLAYKVITGFRKIRNRI